jgi:hypothetical protein
VTVPIADPCAQVDPSLLRALDGLRSTLVGWSGQTWQHPHHDRPHHAIVALADLDLLVRRLDATREIACFGGVERQDPRDVCAVLLAGRREAMAGEGFERRRYFARYDTDDAAGEAYEKLRAHPLLEDLRQPLRRTLAFVALLTPEVHRLMHESGSTSYIMGRVMEGER